MREVRVTLGDLPIGHRFRFPGGVPGNYPYIRTAKSYRSTLSKDGPHEFPPRAASTAVTVGTFATTRAAALLELAGDAPASRNTPAKKARRNASSESEREAWEDVGEWAAQALQRLGGRADSVTKNLLNAIIAKEEKMTAQLRDVGHVNPPLTVFSLVNPPTRGAQLMSDRLYTIEYKHKGNGKNYFHDFKKGTLMHALPDGSIRISRPGAKVWGDYPPE